MPKDLTTILAKRKPHRRIATILLEPELKVQIDDLLKQIVNEEDKRSKHGSLAEAPASELREKVKALYEEAREHSVDFVFQDIGRAAFVELIKAHPVSEETKKLFLEYEEDEPEYEPDTFVPALLSATAVDPLISLEQAKDIYDTWSEGDLETLFMTAWMVCRERTSIPFSAAGIEPTPNTESSSITGSTSALDGSDSTPNSTT